MPENRFATKYSAIQQGQDNIAGTPSPNEGAQQGQSSNRFAAKYNSQQPQTTGNSGQTTSPQQSTEQTKGADGPSTFMDFVDGFNRQFERYAEGGIQLGLKGASALGLNTSNAQASLANIHTQKEQNYNEAFSRSPYAATTGAVLGSVGSAMAYGGPAVGSSAGLAAKTAAGAASGAGLGALEYATPEDSRLTRAAVGGTIGAAIPAAVDIGSNLLSAMVNKPGVSGYVAQLFTPKKAALQDIAYRAGTVVGEDTGKVAQSVKDATDLGITLTPGQALGSAGMRAEEKSLALNDVSKRAANQVNTNSINKIQEHIKGAIDDMAPAGTKELKDDLYSKLGNLSADDETAKSLISNPIIGDRLAKINKAGSSTYRELPDNSVIKLDKVKQSIDEQLFNDQHALDSSTKLDPIVRDGLMDSRSQIVNSLDALHPEYAEARKVSQSLILQKQYNHLIDKVSLKEGNNLEPTFDDVNKALFGNTEKVKLFLQDIEKTGGDVRQAHKIVNVANQLYKSTLSNVTSKAGKFEGDVVPLYGRDSGLVQRMVNGLSGERYGKALLNLTIGGNKWADEVTNILAAPKGPKQNIELLKALTKAGTSRAASTTVANEVGIKQNSLK